MACGRIAEMAPGTSLRKNGAPEIAPTTLPTRPDWWRSLVAVHVDCASIASMLPSGLAGGTTVTVSVLALLCGSFQVPRCVGKEAVHVRCRGRAFVRPCAALMCVRRSVERAGCAHLRRAGRIGSAGCPFGRALESVLRAYAPSYRGATKGGSLSSAMRLRGSPRRPLARVTRLSAATGGALHRRSRAQPLDLDNGRAGRVDKDDNGHARTPPQPRTLVLADVFARSL
jgi:hypothetical protein